nr:hypothetical protein [Streptomyces sp. HUAS 15-9]
MEPDADAPVVPTVPEPEVFAQELPNAGFNAPTTSTELPHAFTGT